MNNLVKKILTSEKSFQAAAGGKYSFIVDKRAGKDSIKKTVEELFSVSVMAVNSMNYKGKVKTVKRKPGVRNDFKKVILSLKKGDKIDLFEIEKDEKDAKKDKKAKEEKTRENKTKKDKENKDVEVKIKNK
jgi:large subunit ribosomal protein L23